jgi:hypothetical protein
MPLAFIDDQTEDEDITMKAMQKIMRACDYAADRISDGWHQGELASIRAIAEHSLQTTREYRDLRQRER